MCLHDVKNFLNNKTLSSKRDDFLSRKYDVICQLCHSYAKGPFCVTKAHKFNTGINLSECISNTKQHELNINSWR